MTMSAPWRASSSAVARPMPRPAPVTMAICPLSSMVSSYGKGNELRGFARLSTRGPQCSARAGGKLIERTVAGYPHVVGQAQHALGDDVAQNLVRARGDADARRGEQRFLEGSPQGRRVLVHDHAAHVEEIHGEGGDLLRLGRVDELADGILRPRRLPAGERGHGAEARKPYPLRLHVEVG